MKTIFKNLLYWTIRLACPIMAFSFLWNAFLSGITASELENPNFAISIGYWIQSLNLIEKTLFSFGLALFTIFVVLLIIKLNEVLDKAESKTLDPRLDIYPTSPISLKEIIRYEFIDGLIGGTTIALLLGGICGFMGTVILLVSSHFSFWVTIFSGLTTMIFLFIAISISSTFIFCFLYLLFSFPETIMDTKKINKKVYSSIN